MADVTGGAGRQSVARSEVPSTWRSRLRLMGPGLVVAATGVGAGDMVTSLTAGTQFGTVLIWAIILGAAVKFALTEGLGASTWRLGRPSSRAGTPWAGGRQATLWSTWRS
jgi:Mn2+/Fe2+ NRAMP family transporter